MCPYALLYTENLLVLADGLSACLYDEREQRGLHRSLQWPGPGAGCERAVHPAAVRRIEFGSSHPPPSGGHSHWVRSGDSSPTGLIQTSLLLRMEHGCGERPKPSPTRLWKCNNDGESRALHRSKQVRNALVSPDLFFSVKCPLKGNT